MSGATRWFNTDKALIQRSLRYKTDDQLWFRFFYEAAHIVLHGKRLIFLDVDGSEGDLENEANSWAADALIPRSEYEEFAASARHSKSSIRSFARSLSPLSYVPFASDCRGPVAMLA